MSKLGSDGKFVDSQLETEYASYLSRKAREGKPPRDRSDWNHSRDYWLNDSPMARGNAFNSKAVRENWYDFHEIVLENGKRLDSYDPINGLIVSRKATNFSDIEIETFESYLREMNNKYAPETRINSRKYETQFEELGIETIEGRLILEVPDVNLSSPRRAEFENLASTYNITISYKPE